MELSLVIVVGTTLTLVPLLVKFQVRLTGLDLAVELRAIEHTDQMLLQLFLDANDLASRKHLV